MAITALTGLAPQWYTPPQQGDEAEATRFYIRPLNGLEYTQVMSEMRVDEDGQYFKGGTVKFIITNCVLGWEKFLDETGKEIAFSNNGFAVLPMTVQMQLAYEILERSNLTAEQKKT